jgi:transcriptional regulator with XRE-family HTH domain
LAKATFGSRLRERRLSMDLTQIEFCTLTGITQPTLSRMERGRVDVVRPHDACRIASTLGVSVDYLVGYNANNDSVSPEDREMMKLFMGLAERDRRVLLSMARIFHKEG